MDSSFDSFDSESKPNTEDLKGEIEALKQENALLKAQFDEAVLASKKVKDAQKDADNLRLQLSNERKEKEELCHVLELTKRNVKDSENQILKQKRIANEEKAALIKQSNEKIESLESMHEAEIKSLSEQIEELMAEKESNEITTKTVAARLRRLFQTAERYFEISINSVDELSAAFSRPKPVVQQQPAQEKTEKPNKENDEKRAFYKSKAKEFSKKIDQLQRELLSAKSENLEVLTAVKRENESLKAKVEALEEQKLFNEKKNEELIQSLEKRLSATKDELAKARSQVPIIQAPQQVSQPVKEQTREPEVQVVEQKVENQKPQAQVVQPSAGLQECIDDLKKQISDAECRNEDLINKFVTLQKQFNDQQSLLTNEQIDHQSLISVHKETVKELETLRQTLSDRKRPLEEAQLALNDYKQKDEQSKLKIAAAKKSISDLNDKISEMQREEVKQQDVIDQMRRELADAKDENKQLEKSCANAKEESITLRHKLENIKPLTANDLLPPSIWVMPDADGPLSEQITKIASNGSLQPASKLQAIYSAITKYYKTTIDSLEEELQDYEEEKEKIRNLINKFFIDASIIINGTAFTYEDFFNEDAGQQFITQITQLRNSYESLKQDHEETQKFVKEFNELFGESQDLIAQARTVKTTLDKAFNECEKRGMKYRKLKRVLREQIQLSEEKVNELNRKNDNLAEENSGLESKLKETQKTLSLMKNENTKLQRELLEEKETREMVENEMQNQNQKYLEELNMAHNMEQQQSHNSIKKLDMTNSQKEEEISDLSQKLENATLQIKLLTEKNADLQQEIEDIKQDFDLDVSELTEKYESEKEHMTQSFNKSLEELRQQCTKHREDIIKLSEQLNAEETNNGILKSTVAHCKKETAKVARELKLAKEQMERDRKLIESECRTKIIAAESNYERKLDEERAKAQDEKKSIFTFIADEFHQFYKPVDRINEATFRNVVHNVHDTLESMAASDSSIRNMLGATDGQTTEDAVAQHLLN